MISIRRDPIPRLRPFVTSVWGVASDRSPRHARERVLPSGTMHLVVRIGGAPLVVFDDASGAGARRVGTAVVGGPRSAHYVRDVSGPTRSVGIELGPGAAKLVFAGAATELAEAHTSLDDLWGADAERLRDRIAEARSLEGAMDVLESAMTERLPRVRGVHPAIARALDTMAASADRIGPAVIESGLSHRAFIDRFRREVGLPPKQFARARRLARATEALAAHGSLADVALRAGYADQSHMTREFAEMAGVTPSAVRATGASRHVPIVAGE